LRSFQFTKMQGLGNDFVVLEGPQNLTADEVETICDRRFGIGADGVLVVTRGDPISMEYRNADGSAAEMCGNGLRCVAKYAYDSGWAPDRNFTIQTSIGLRGARVLEDTVEVELGRPRLDGVDRFADVDYRLVDMGNPHAVSFVGDLETTDVEGIGSQLQSEFADGANIEFAHVNGDVVEMRVWERGVGETLACGTGMAAVAAVAQETYGMGNPTTIKARGGTATVDLRDGVAWLQGPAEYSFRGSVGER
jgi:diaminopimelate epimerase